MIKKKQKKNKKNILELFPFGCQKLIKSYFVIRLDFFKYIAAKDKFN